MTLAINPSTSSLPILKNWGVQRKISKNEGIGFSGHLIRKIGLVVFAIIAIPLLVIGTIYNLGVSIKERYIIRYYPNHILSIIRKMKQKEELDKFNTMVKVFNTLHMPPLLKSSELAKNLTQDVKSRLEAPVVTHNRGIRIILRLLSAQDNFDTRWIKALKNPQINQLLDFSNPNIPDAFLKEVWKTYPELSFNISWSEVIHKVEKENILARKIEKEALKFERTFKALFHIIKQPPGSNPGASNQKFIAAFRNVLNTSAYQALKEDASHPAIQLLHRFASAMWTKAPSTEAYASVGDNVAQQLGLKEVKDMDGTALAKQLAKSHEQMEKVHYSDQGLNKIAYALTHPLQTMGLLASEGGVARHIPGIFNLDEYDSHGTLANNPSLQGTTTITLNTDSKDVKANVYTCYGGSPTIGDYKVAPEFEAVLVAAENNQMAPTDLQDPSIPMIVNYNNLQNLDKKHGEGPRSHTIMLLNQKYPLSFRGATFAKDSNLYLMPKQEHVIWNNPKDFGEKMLEQLLKSFDPKEKGHGFYFHGKREDWESLFVAVIENATSYFAGLQSQIEMTPKDLQGAYQEYVYSMLTAVIEIKSIRAIADQGISDFIIMVIAVCKENIDRGAMENTKTMHTKIDEENEEKRLSLLLGVMHSRALSARDRVILKTRMPQILNFMKTTEPTQFRRNQQDLFQKLKYNVVKADYQPYITV